MRRALVTICATAIVHCAGCGDSSSSSGSAGNAGSAGSAGSATTTTETGGGGAAGSATTGGAAGSMSTGGGGTGGTGGSMSTGGGGTGGALVCPEPGNPYFGSCLEDFLKGCYEPDTKGMCTMDQGNVMWSDGYKDVSNGPMPGLYGPGDAQPCITLGIMGSKITATKGNETLVYEADQASMMGIVTCPDGSQVKAPFDQVTNFNICKGLNCPP